MIGDTHFGHKSIIKWQEERKHFETIEEHDQALVDNWNSVVGKKDIVWHLGDVVWSRGALHYLDQLNGQKYLVLGNHDNQYPTERWMRYFVRVAAAEEFDGGVLTHIPIHPYQKYRFEMNVHGHTHDKLVTDHENNVDPFYWNVSCEQVNLTPIPYEELKKRHTQ